MPRRKKAGLCMQYERAKAAKKRRENINNETLDEKNLRLSQNANQTANARANESNDQRLQRLSEDATRHALFRKNESKEQQTFRLSTESTRISSNRAKVSTLTASMTIVPAVDESTIIEHYCGKMNMQCKFCASVNFVAEKLADGNFTYCCDRGKVGLPPLESYPELLKSLLKGEHVESQNFNDNIRSYNSAFGFASMGAKLAQPKGFGPYVFRIHGQIYHRAGALHPTVGQKRKFAQLYILDAQEATTQRMMMKENSKCTDSLMSELGNLFNKNKYAVAYKMLHEVEQEALRKAENSVVSMVITQNRDSDLRRYNTPQANEVAVIFQNADGEPPLERDLIIYSRSEQPKFISVLNANLEPMTYPVLFPTGYDQGWHEELRKIGTSRDTRITQMDYYGYRLATRMDQINPELVHFNPLLNAGKLTQQFIVDAYVKTESNRLNYIRTHQTELRSEKYQGLIDHMNSEMDAQGGHPEKAIILPSSFSGSPRNMNQHYQDAMAIVRKYGKPDLFVTMTCNPKWKEITENLEPWQKAEHRPDLVARVFNLKLKELLNDIWVKHVLGVPKAKVHVIEFQKRGLPHAHLLIILKQESKLKNVEDIDNLVTAEFPCKNTNPRLYDIVSKNMIHGPCGELNPNSPCMRENKCTKEFPKRYSEQTVGNDKGYPRYRRRLELDPEVVHTVRNNIVDNRWIVPYNPYLTLKYNCHINVEICASVKSVKYLFKYVYKGHDCANVELSENGVNREKIDEIKSYMDSRYVSAPEAMWRLYGFKMHQQSHSIVRLSVHLPNEQSVVFRPNQVTAALEAAENSDSTLMAWFKINAEFDNVQCSNPTKPFNEVLFTDCKDTKCKNAKHYYYTEFPKHFVFDKGCKKDKKPSLWRPRKKGAEKTIGRMYSVSISDQERYFLRLLLLHVKGATSFENLRTVDGTEYETFREAANARGLLQTDDVWDQTLLEASLAHMPYQLRQVFATICLFGTPADPLKLWNKHKECFMEDFVNRHEMHSESCVNCEQMALRDMQETLILCGKTCSEFGLPTPPAANYSSEYYDTEAEKILGETMLSNLNAEQLSAFEIIFDAIYENLNDESKCYFLDGPGGSGKTYLYETFLSIIRGKKDITLPAASTGIAANLLKGGRTYHSQYKLPVPLDDASISSMRLNSLDANCIRNAKLLIWDESTMAPSHALDAVDRLLKEIMNNNIPFGGKVLLLGGDFRQVLPVVPHAHRAAVVQASIKFSKLWKEFKTIKLKHNVRSVDPDYSEWLIQLGNGTLTNDVGLDENLIEIPEDYLSSSIVKDIFGEKLLPEDVPKFSKRAILCPRNEDVDKKNLEILDILEGEETTYISIDSIVGDNEQDRLNFPVEFLNSLTPNGMPPHKLKVKIGAIIMLLRNLNTKRGMCNGTRLIVKQLQPNLIRAELLTGSAAGGQVFIPRIDIQLSDASEVPIDLKRRQFPIKLAFAMTINKAQGQTLEKVGIFLPNPVFSHGQLYVAFSRVKRALDVKVQVIEGQFQGKLVKYSDKVYTPNIVYREIFGN